jgi:hypothetical protein
VAGEDPQGVSKLFQSESNLREPGRGAALCQPRMDPVVDQVAGKQDSLTGKPDDAHILAFTWANILQDKFEACNCHATARFQPFSGELSEGRVICLVDRRPILAFSRIVTLDACSRLSRGNNPSSGKFAKSNPPR